MLPKRFWLPVSTSLRVSSLNQRAMKHNSYFTIVERWDYPTPPLAVPQPAIFFG